MTETQPHSRAAAKRREQAWRDAVHRRQEELRALPPADLDALVAGAFFQNLDLTGMPFSTSWDGLSRIVGHMRERGYTLQLYSFEPSHLDWMNRLPSTISGGYSYQPAEVTVVDIRHQLSLPPVVVHLRARAETLPQAAAITAVLVAELEQGVFTLPPPPEEDSRQGDGWSEDRRQRKSEEMKAYWQRKRSENMVKQGTQRP